MPPHDRLEGDLGAVAPTVGEPLQERAVGQAGDGLGVEDRAEVSQDRAIFSIIRQGTGPPSATELRPSLSFLM